jgi:urea transport system permease protein
MAFPMGLAGLWESHVVPRWAKWRDKKTGKPVEAEVVSQSALPEALDKTLRAPAAPSSTNARRDVSGAIPGSI